MQRTPFSVLALLLTAGSCARHTIPPVVLINQTRIGPADVVRALTEALVGSRSSRWAAYYVAFVAPSTH